MMPTDLTDQQSTQVKFLATVKRWSWIILVITSIMQLIFFFSIELLWGLSAIIIAWQLTMHFFLRPSMLNKFPLSTWLVLGFTSTQFYFPLLFTSVEGSALTYNLEYPDEIFLHSLLALLVLMLAHAIYRSVARPRSGRRSFSITKSIGLFTAPSHAQLWFMGFVGLGATVYTFFTGEAVTTGKVTGDPLDKFIQALIPFSYAPYFILSYKLFGGVEPKFRRIAPALVAFTVLLFAISIGRNSRGAFMFGFTALGFSYFLGLLLGVYENKLLSAKNFIIAGAVVWLLTGPVADLGTAMVIVRGDRTDVPAMELLSLTIDAYGDKEAIKARRDEDKDDYSNDGWDERYLDNVFTARFANIKFNDLSLIQYHKLSEFDPDMLQYAQDFIVAGFPNVLIEFFGFDVDKETVYSVSVGDFIYLLAGGNGFPAGFRTGHFSGVGMATFSWWYLGLVCVGMIIVFYLFDKFYRAPSHIDPAHKYAIGRFSCCGLLALTSIFQFMPNESVVILVPFILRGWPEMVLLYVILFHMGRMTEAIFTIRHRLRVAS